jgi:hypothetical protein
MVMDETPPNIDQPGAEAEAARALLARKIKWLARQFNSAGTHLGYRYVDSPVIVGDGTPEPPDDPLQVVPSTWPGSRAPHAWMADGRSTLDLLGRDAVLLRFGDPEGGDEGLLAAARAVGMPMSLEDLRDPAIARLYEARLVLVRPDGHVAWRGASVPQDAAALLDLVRGA